MSKKLQLLKKIVTRVKLKSKVQLERRRFHKPPATRSWHIERRLVKTQIVRGQYGIRCLQTAKITPKQFESVRKVFARSIKKTVGFFWLRTEPFVNVTAKPLEVRMGKGKGRISSKMSKVNAGTVLFEFDGSQMGMDISKVFYNIQQKLPFKVSLVSTRRFR